MPVSASDGAHRHLFYAGCVWGSLRASTWATEPMSKTHAPAIVNKVGAETCP